MLPGGGAPHGDADQRDGSDTNEKQDDCERCHGGPVPLQTEHWFQESVRHFGDIKPGEVIHSLTCAAVSACLAFRKSRSRSLPKAAFLACSLRRRPLPP